MRIYTRTGDSGQTGLVSGGRISKSSPRIHAVGEVDELNAIIGIARLHSLGTPLDPTLEKVQNLLFDLGAEMASDPNGEWQYEALKEQHTRFLEISIDEQTAELKPLKNFILPGGSHLAAHLHHARAVCRRVERSIQALHELQPVRTPVLTFINRLSDWLFTASRTANALSNVEDLPWRRIED